MFPIAITTRLKVTNIKTNSKLAGVAVDVVAIKNSKTMLIITPIVAEELDAVVADVTVYPTVSTLRTRKIHPKTISNSVVQVGVAVVVVAAMSINRLVVRIRIREVTKVARNDSSESFLSRSDTKKRSRTLIRTSLWLSREGM